MTSFQGYANDVENEKSNVESMRSFLKIDLGCKNQMFNAWNTFFFKWAHWFNVDSGYKNS